MDLVKHLMLIALATKPSIAVEEAWWTGYETTSTSSPVLVVCVAITYYVHVMNFTVYHYY
jgi:hypothetical protein